MLGVVSAYVGLKASVPACDKAKFYKKESAFTYNGSEDRVKMELKKSGVKELARYYLSGCYEIDDQSVGGLKEKLYLSGDFYTAAAVYVKQGSGKLTVALLVCYAPYVPDPRRPGTTIEDYYPTH